MAQLDRRGVEPCLLDIAVSEAISVLCRRFEQKKRSADLPELLARVREWMAPESILWVASHAQRVFGEVLDLVAATEGRLNFNDALMVILQREALIGPVATFDADLLGLEGFDVIELEDEPAP